MTARPCTCPFGERPLGRLHGVNMGRGVVRLDTTPGCPEHDSCHEFTRAYRDQRKRGRWLWCPHHQTSACPAPTGGTGQ